MSVSSKFFILNRQRFMHEIDSSYAIFTAYTALQKSHDTAHAFVQESNFWWLTGIEEPDWQLIIDGSKQKSWLVAPDIGEIHRIFDGGLSPAQAKKISGVDEVIDAKEGKALVDSIKKNATIYTLGADPHAKYYSFLQNPMPQKLHKNLKKNFQNVKDSRQILAKLRAIKQPQELKAIRTAVELTKQAFMQVKQNIDSYAYEYQIEATFDYVFKNQGAQHAYDPIIASGKNAVTLHYSSNNSALKPGLVLLDVGARVGGYAADITRTYVVKKATKRQHQVHQAVKNAHQQIVQLLRPGLSVKDYHEQVDAIMKQAIKSLGLNSDEKSYRKYFPHAISHGLGIDVHDSLGRPNILEPGMVLTVEPGIYIPEEGIGVRLEDDILIVKNGYENLSHDLPLDI